MAKAVKDLSSQRRSIRGFNSPMKAKTSPELYADLKDLYKSKKKGYIDKEKYLKEKEKILKQIVCKNDISTNDTYKSAGELFVIRAVTAKEYENIIQSAMNTSLKNGSEENNDIAIKKTPTKRRGYLYAFLDLHGVLIDDGTGTGMKKISWLMVFMKLFNFVLLVILFISKIIFVILDFITKIFVTCRIFRKL